jgi:hypothetical protein
MIKIVARQNYRLPVCFPGYRPAMTMLALEPSSIAVLSCDIRCAMPIPHLATIKQARRYIGRLPNKHSMHVSNTPPAAKSP